MDLRTVETLKQQVVTQARLADDFPRPDDDPGFAIGVGFTEKEDEYVLAIRVKTEADKTRVITRYSNLWLERGMDADVRVTGLESADLAEDEQTIVKGAPLAIGASVSHVNDRSGTLGFFAKRNGVKGFVSCNHVIARVDAATIGDTILSPGASDSGVDPDDFAGKLNYVVSLRGGGRKIADCAFAEADPKRFPANPGLVGRDGDLLDRRVFIRRYLPVIKIGRKTGRTEGRVIAGNLDHFEVPYGALTVKFNDVFEIETADRGRDPDPFCERGDSGALVYTPNRELVGLLFVKRPAGGPGNSGLAYINPIQNVLKALVAKPLV